MRKRAGCVTLLSASVLWLVRIFLIIVQKLLMHLPYTVQVPRSPSVVPLPVARFGLSCGSFRRGRGEGVRAGRTRRVRQKEQLLTFVAWFRLGSEMGVARERGRDAAHRHGMRAQILAGQGGLVYRGACEWFIDTV